MFPELLADENVDIRIVRHLRESGFSVAAIQEKCPGSSDKDVLNIARENGLLLVTEDADFGEMIFSHKLANIGVVFLRYHVIEREEITKSLIDILQKHGYSLRTKFTVITIHKIRIRDL
ncbi:MAG: DUF5615 family PIN-like protein [Chitinivibrionales bacterium]|nr:DUF5615 family PIN-like protein [Chitinivibrionales bacterium]MDD5673861.1 DUF5615 family PIN-like protein [Chitinivibrionales bacterium]